MNSLINSIVQLWRRFLSNISTWSTTAASNNAATPDGFPEGQSPSSLNDCGRTLMAAIRTQHENAQWIDYGHTPTKVDSDTFTVSGDQTSIYDAGRRIKFSGSVSGYATISSSSYSAPNTTVNVSAASWTGTLTAVAVGIISGTNSSLATGSGSGLDADTLDGVQGSGYLLASSVVSAYKASNETVAVASAQNDNELALSLAANTAYEISLFISVSSAFNGNINFDFSASSALQSELWRATAANANTSYGHVNNYTVGGSGALAVISLDGSGIHITGSIKTHATNATTLTFRWWPSTASNLTVKAGSWFKAVKL